jgi:hypothetical protein
MSISTEEAQRSTKLLKAAASNVDLIFVYFVRVDDLDPVNKVFREHFNSNTFDVKEGLGKYASTNEYPYCCWNCKVR